MDFKLVVDRDMQGTPHPYLSAATRKAFDAGMPLRLTMENWQGFEDRQRSIRVSQKLTDLLQLIAKRSKTPGQRWTIKVDQDYPLIAAENAMDERYGYTVLLAESGLAAIDLLKRHPATSRS
jgi:hypothetical protein